MVEEDVHVSELETWMFREEAVLKYLCCGSVSLVNFREIHETRFFTMVMGRCENLWPLTVTV